MSNPLFVVPSVGGTVSTPLELATYETLPVAFDYTQSMAVGDSVSGPSSVVVNTSYGLNAGQKITPTNSPTLVGNVVTQILTGSQLAAYNSYRLDVTVTLNTNKVLTASLNVNVPY